jgi:ferrous iron transport protein B
MSCSARLPVYTLLISAFFAQYGAATRGGIMLSCYVLGIVAAVVTAWIFKKTFMKSTPAAFILELPTYKRPQAKEVLRQVVQNTWAFIAKAGTTIFCLSVILWAMTYYPRMPEKQRLQVIEATQQSEHARIGKSGLDPTYQADLDARQKAIDEDGLRTFERRASAYLEIREQQVADTADQAVASAELRHSIAGRLGHVMEPIIRPLGFDWKMGVGLVGAFAAREVFVSTMGIVYSAGDVEDDTQSLSDAMRSDRYDNGQPVWTPLVAFSLLIWFVLAMQCMSTLAIVRRETGGWKWPVFMLLYMNGLAYVLSLLVFQLGSRWFA